MCLAVEPSASTKAKIVTNTDEDDWELAVQYEHTIVEQEPLILTKID